MGWEPKVSFKDGVSEVLKEQGLIDKGKEEKTTPKSVEKITLPENTEPEKKEEKTVNRPQISIRRRRIPKIPQLKKILPLVMGALLTYFALFPGLSLAFNTYSGYKELVNFEQNVKNLDLEAAEKNAQTAEEKLTSSGRNLDDLSWIFSLVGKGQQKNSLVHFFQAGAFLSSALEQETKGVRPLTNAVLNLVSQNPTALPTNDLRVAATALTEAQEKTLLAEAHLKKADTNIFGGRLAPKFKLLEEVTAALKETTPLVKTLTLELPEILGSEAPKTYLLVFQNSNELRPTGGFIGSYGKLVLNKGQIEKLVVDDVYNLDGLLETKGVDIEPPAPLKTHLGVDRWLMRDANWSPDFPTSAEQIRYFYSQAMGDKIDGVLGLDLNIVQNLLELTGPIYLAQFNESVTTDNFFEKTEFHSEADYYSGSPQKKTFLSLLSAKLLEKVLQLETEDFGKLAQIVKNSLGERHFLVYFPGGEVANILAQKNWDGGVRSFAGDYLMVVDANVGATKANYYVKRNLNYTVKNIDRQGTWEGVLTVNYVHGAASNAWPGGAYKNYLQVYVPKGSVLKKVAKSSEGVDTKALDVTAEVDQTEENGKTVFGTVFTLDAGKSLSVTFTYDLPSNTLSTEKSRALLVQKQPGTVADPLTVDFLTPFGKEVVGAPEGSKRIGDLWRYSGNLREDRVLEYTLR